MAPNRRQQMCSPVAAARTHLASEHERQRPVAADDLTLAHDRRETLKILDRQRHQSGDRQHESAARRSVAPLIQTHGGAGSRGEVAGKEADRGAAPLLVRMVPATSKASL